MNYIALPGYLLPFSWGGFWKYFQWSLEFLYIWPMLLVSLALVANLGAALIHKWPFRPDRWKKEYWIAFVNLLFIPTTIAIGVVGAIDPARVPRQPNTL